MRRGTSSSSLCRRCTHKRRRFSRVARSSFGQLWGRQRQHRRHRGSTATETGASVPKIQKMGLKGARFERYDEDEKGLEWPHSQGVSPSLRHEAVSQYGRPPFPLSPTYSQSFTDYEITPKSVGP